MRVVLIVVTGLGAALLTGGVSRPCSAAWVAGGPLTATGLGR